MSDEKFLIKYEELLNKDYCNCNEMNCLDNNSPRRMLNIAKKLQQENQQLKRNCNIGNENLNFYREEYKKLEDNWNKLKEYVEKAYNNGERIDTKEIKDKMRELESRCK